MSFSTRVTTSLSKLQISPPSSTSKPSNSTEVADSWENDLGGSDTETEDASTSSTTKPLGIRKSTSGTSTDYPAAPPPTPASPSGRFSYDDDPPFAHPSQLAHSRDSSGSNSPTRRPEKTTAVAGRLIAGALGVRAPKRTEEQRAYDKAIREKEMRRRQKEKEEAERKKMESEKAKKSVWED